MLRTNSTTDSNFVMQYNITMLFIVRKGSHSFRIEKEVATRRKLKNEDDDRTAG